MLPFFNTKFKYSALISLASFMVLSACGGGGSDSSNDTSQISDATVLQAPETGEAGDGRLEEIVSYLRIEAGLPALAAVLVHDGEVIELAADGNRSIEDATEVTTDDKWHIGSISKSMTSTLAASLVKQGVISWDTTLLDVYPEFEGSMVEQYKSVTLDQLLSNTSGLPSQLPTFNSYFSNNDEITLQRLQVVEEVTKLTPNNEVGEFHYSNFGYIVAGSMMEKVTGTTWEALMQQNIFAPLSMLDSGFGAPDENGNLQHPVGHNKSGGNWNAVIAGGSQPTDNPAMLGPAGTIHASLHDMAHYLSAHLAGARADMTNDFLSVELFEKLHTPMPNVDYALGWGISNSELQHNGSNTMWLAVVVVQPETNSAFFIATNAADLDSNNSMAVSATNKLVSELRQRISAAYGE